MIGVKIDIVGTTTEEDIATIVLKRKKMIEKVDMKEMSKYGRCHRSTCVS